MFFLFFDLLNIVLVVTDPNLHITENMICAGYLQGSSKTSCHGDSGGPYVCQDKNSRWILQGITSWGNPSCQATQLNTVFSRAARFRNWINSYIFN